MVLIGSLTTCPSRSNRETGRPVVVVRNTPADLFASGALASLA